MKTKLFLLLALPMMLMSFASDSTVPPSEGENIKFKIKNAGITVDGSFEEFTADITYDKSKPNASVFNGTIKASSINTGIEMRDEHLVGEEYFDAKNHPNLTFKSTSVALLTNGKLKVKGTLTIKSTSKSVELIVTPTESGDQTFFETTLKLDRLDYEVGESSWVPSDDVPCTIKVAVN